MRAAIQTNIHSASAICPICGIPLDSQYFDVSGIEDAPPAGRTVVLAQFSLPPQYCGVLQYFAQFTDQYAKDQTKVRTQGLEWTILSDESPLFPYIQFNRIINPWGYNGFPIAIRLAPGATIKFVVRGVPSNVAAADVIKEAGGRLLGRFWYNTVYGDVVRHNT